MIPISNALSAKQVRIHGMSTSKWTTKDKITQYKGLVNLYKRDRAISQVDTTVAGKRQYKGLINLRKTIENDRHELDNAIRGDRQQLRNTLADHRQMQLAYQNSEPKKVVENVHHSNFTKRKLLDKLKYQMKLKSQELIDLKLEEAFLEDRLKYEFLGQIPEEKMAQIITGKVQDALLKKEAALAIQQSYVQIIDVMKKDALYFDSVLATIQNDYWYQCRCVLNAAKQGQLATEYKHDREQEYAELETAIMKDMKTQRVDLETARQQVEQSSSNLRHLLRRDSDITTCVVKVDVSPDLSLLQTDVRKVEASLNYLKEVTLVTSFEKIFPSLQEQLRQKKRLRKMAMKCERNRDIIMNKLDHAQLMANVLKNSMVESTFEYKKRKKELLQGIIVQLEKTENFDDLRKTKQKLIAKVRVSLRQLQQLCKPIKKEGEDKKPTSLRPVTSSGEPMLQDPDVDEIDGCNIISELVPKITFLMGHLPEQFDPNKIDTAYKYYEILMKQRSLPEEVDTVTQESLLEGFVTECSHLLTREDIKKQSAQIVAANTKDDDMMPMFTTKKKRKFNK